MVGSTSSLSLSADAGSARILKGAASTSALVPRRNGWTSRAVRSRAYTHAHAHAHGHPGLMPAHHPVIMGDNNNNSNSNNSTTDGLSGGGCPTTPASDSDSSSAAPAVPHPTAATTRAPSSVPVFAITCGAVGGIVALAVVLALVYVRRIRRRVKSMKRRTNVLGPELAPMSPSQLSHLSTIDSPPNVKFDIDGNRIFFTPTPRTMSELTNHLPPPLMSATPSVSSPTTIIELPGIPLSPIRTSTIILGPPPPAAKRSPIRSSNPNNPHSNHPRSPIYSSRAAAVPWPLITATLSSSHRPQHDYEL
ncbi:hypothetical protein F5888DRAFT_1705230 [Russula emetica]|nr:hypothetical protein F5888DRAFT_1705230 [Russula emetica]